MKTRLLVVLSFVLVLIGITVPVGQTSAGDMAKITTFTATEIYDPFNLLGSGGVGKILEPGTLICLGSEPTGDPMQPCPPGSRIQRRDIKIVARLDSDYPGLNGWLEVVANLNWDSDGTGPVWGTVSHAFDEGGTCDGPFAGIRFKEDDHWVELLHVVCHATGGAFDGMQAVIENRIVSYFPVPIAYVGDLEGRILGPPSK